MQPLCGTFAEKIPKFFRFFKIASFLCRLGSFLKKFAAFRTRFSLFPKLHSIRKELNDRDLLTKFPPKFPRSKFAKCRRTALGGATPAFPADSVQPCLSCKGAFCVQWLDVPLHFSTFSKELWKTSGFSASQKVFRKPLLIKQKSLFRGMASFQSVSFQNSFQNVFSQNSSNKS